MDTTNWSNSLNNIMMGNIFIEFRPRVCPGILVVYEEDWVFDWINFSWQCKLSTLPHHSTCPFEDSPDTANMILDRVRIWDSEGPHLAFSTAYDKVI